MSLQIARLKRAMCRAELGFLFVVRVKDDISGENHGGPMNKEQFKGNWQQFKGELKKNWGQLTDNDLMEAEGDYDKFLGVVQKRYGDRKEEIEHWTDEWYERNAPIFNRGTESRNQR